MVEPAEEHGRSSETRSYRALEVDRYVGLRIRMRRIALGLTQQQMAQLIGVTYQQAYKYETGGNRIVASQLYHIAEALGVDVNYFFDDVQPHRNRELAPTQQMVADLARHISSIKDPNRQQQVCALVRAFAECEDATETESNSPHINGTAASIKFVIKLMGVWAINESEVARLLGFENQADVSDLIAGAKQLDTRDAKDRVRHLLRIREALHGLFRNIDAEREWLHEARPELNGESPLALLLEGSMEGLLTVSQLVQWMVGR